MTFIRRHWLIILILLLAAYLRLYRLPATQTFLEDEGRDLLISYRMLDTFRPVLLGPQTSTGNMYLGPLYYYLTTPALFLAHLNPLGPTVFIALTGVFTVFLLFILGKKLFNPFAAYMAATMYALLPLPVTFTRNSWNPNLAPVFSLLTYYLLHRIILAKDQSWKNYIALGLCAGALIQMHYLSLLFLVGVGLSLVLTQLKIPLLLLKRVSYSILGFILIMSPFIVFEFRNDFVNTKAITRFIEAKEEHNIRYSLPLELWSDKVTLVTTRLFSSAFGRDALTPDPARLTITLVIIIILITGLIYSYRRPTPASRPYQLLFYLFLVPLLLTGIYQENVHLHYLGFFFPLLYLLVAGTLAVLSSIRIILLIPILLLSIYATPQLFSYLKSNSTNQVIRAQEVAQYILNDSAGQNYNVVSAEGAPTTPYLYFLAISGNRPSNTKTNLLYMICQGEECSEQDINSPFIYMTGQAHPTITNYLGHPLSNYYDSPRQILSNQHVSHGAWVAKIMIE